MSKTKTPDDLCYDGEDLAELVAKYKSDEITYEEFYDQLMAMD